MSFSESQYLWQLLAIDPKETVVYVMNRIRKLENPSDKDIFKIELEKSYEVLKGHAERDGFVFLFEAF